MSEAKVELSGSIDSATAALVIASVDSSRDQPAGDVNKAQRDFALAVMPALAQPPKAKKWILLDVSGRWSLYVGPMEQLQVEEAITVAGFTDAGIFGDVIIPMWATMEEMAAARKQRRKRSPESIERTRAKAKAAWARKKAAPK